MGRRLELKMLDMEIDFDEVSDTLSSYVAGVHPTLLLAMFVGCLYAVGEIASRISDFVEDWRQKQASKKKSSKRSY
jgi:hypothetical protein